MGWEEAAERKDGVEERALLLTTGSIERQTYWKKLETQNRDDPGYETNNHGTKRRQHHFTSRSHGNATGQSSILDVDLQQEELLLRVDSQKLHIATFMNANNSIHSLREKE